MKTISDLKKWLKAPENNKRKLAYLLGYSTPETIAVWIRNGRVPKFQEERVNAVIKKGIKK